MLPLGSVEEHFPRVGEVRRARGLDLHPLDDEVRKDLSFDSCWVLETKVARAKLDVPLGDSSGSVGVIEDV